MNPQGDTLLMDVKGRAFRKINVIDLVILLILLAAGIFVINKFTKARVLSPFAQQDKVIITFYSESLPEFAVDAMKQGDVVQDKTTTAVFGRVVDIHKGPDIHFRPDQNGNITQTSKEGYCSVLLTVEGEGIVGDRGTTFGNNDYYVYKYVEIKVGNSFAYTRIRSIMKKESP